MKCYEVLVVDDSSLMRRIITTLIEKDPQLSVVNIARNGLEAIEKIKLFKPDIVIMDVDMPEMDGISALKIIMKENPVPVIMLSNFFEEEAIIKSMELGPVEFFLKSQLINKDADPNMITAFQGCLKALAERSTSSSLVDFTQTNASLDNLINKIDKQLIKKTSPFELVIIGCSTGGPAALQSLLPRFPQNMNVPILILQHMPAGFTKALAERFNKICELDIKEAETGDILEAGHAYIAPAGFQTIVDKNSEGQLIVKVKDHIMGDSVFSPSVNITLNSAAPICKHKLLSVILTGMGNDGLIGCETVKQHKGHVVVESEESCLVYGMPRVVYEAGLADTQAQLSQIHHEIILCTNCGT